MKGIMNQILGFVLKTDLGRDSTGGTPPHEPQNSPPDNQQLMHFEVQGFNARTRSGNSLSGSLPVGRGERRKSDWEQGSTWGTSII